MSKQNGYEQFTLTKKPGMNNRQKRAFDVFKSWGYHRQEIMRMMLELLFSSEELSNPDGCALALAAMSGVDFRGLRVSQALMRVSTPTPVAEPVAPPRVQTPTEELTSTKRAFPLRRGSKQKRKQIYCKGGNDL